MKNISMLLAIILLLFSSMLGCSYSVPKGMSKGNEPDGVATDWVDFIKWDDKTFVNANEPVPADLIEEKIGIVKENAPTNVLNYQPQNGTAAFLSKGTEFFCIQGYSRDSYIAVLINGEYYLYKTHESDGIRFAPSAPNALLPSIMVDDTLYYLSGNNNLGIRIDESEFLGSVISTVPLSQRPTENGQANIDVEGMPYAKYENGIAVLWNNKWALFVTSETLLSQQ